MKFSLRHVGTTCVLVAGSVFAQSASASLISLAATPELALSGLRVSLDSTRLYIGDNSSPVNPVMGEFFPGGPQAFLFPSLATPFDTSLFTLTFVEAGNPGILDDGEFDGGVFGIEARTDSDPTMGSSLGTIEGLVTDFMRDASGSMNLTLQAQVVQGVFTDFGTAGSALGALIHGISDALKVSEFNNPAKFATVSDFGPLAAVPAPAAISVVLVGLLGLGLRRRR